MAPWVRRLPVGQRHRTAEWAWELRAGLLAAAALGVGFRDFGSPCPNVQATGGGGALPCPSANLLRCGRGDPVVRRRGNPDPEAAQSGIRAACLRSWARPSGRFPAVALSAVTAAAISVSAALPAAAQVTSPTPTTPAAPTVSTPTPAPDLPGYRVGEQGPGGGIVFYDAGSRRPWGRYLEVAPPGWAGASRDNRVQWCADDRRGYPVSLQTAQGIGTGKRNTRLITEACGRNSAAGAAAGYRGGGKRDWYLPAKDELAELYRRREVVGGFATGLFWSSTQFPDLIFLAWGQNFRTGDQIEFYKYNEIRVRPIRGF